MQNWTEECGSDAEMQTKIVRDITNVLPMLNAERTSEKTFFFSILFQMIILILNLFTTFYDVHIYSEALPIVCRYHATMQLANCSEAKKKRQKSIVHTINYMLYEQNNVNA